MELSTPARCALRTLTLGFDLAVFLWRRYSSVAQRSVPSPMPAQSRPSTRSGSSRSRRTTTRKTSTQETSPRSARRPSASDSTAGTTQSTPAIRMPPNYARRWAATSPQAAGWVGRLERWSTCASASRAAGRSDGLYAAAIWQLAHAHGHRISDRGPIPATVRQAYAARRRGRAGKKLSFSTMRHGGIAVPSLDSSRKRTPRCALPGPSSPARWPVCAGRRPLSGGIAADRPDWLRPLRSATQRQWYRPPCPRPNDACVPPRFRWLASAFRPMLVVSESEAAAASPRSSSSVTP
jgi:hypothetical protein